MSASPREAELRWAWALTLVACSGGGGDCARLQGLDRDACVAARVLAAERAADARALAATVQDPLVRDAALLRWIAAHRKGLPRVDAEAVCAALSSAEQGPCNRRIDAPHLAR